MSKLKKSIACLVALGVMPSPKAAAVEWSYGIKAGGATSWISPDGEKQKKQWKKDSITSSIWNPGFGAALYMESAFNDHIGMGTELLYNRFGGLAKMELGTIGKWQSSTSIHTIGLPVLLIWSWTGAIRPDFKEDYFHGRFFGGLHPFFCISGVVKTTGATGTKSKKFNMTFDKDNPRFKLGFIGGGSFEFPNGLLLETKGMSPYNLLGYSNKEDRPSCGSFHLSAGYNFAKLLT